MFINQFKYQLKEACSNHLPGMQSHRKMIPPERELEIPEVNKQFVKKSSVLILLYPEDKNIYTCLIKRPASMKHHAGQYAFPGGQIDKSDKDEVATALREANEEIGINKDNVEILGKLTKIYVSVSHFDIQPIIGWTISKPEFSLNPDEVEELLPLPILQFLNGNHKTEAEILSLKGKRKVPCIKYDDKIIWGATAMILSELLDIIGNLPALKDYDH